MMLSILPLLALACSGPALRVLSVTELGPIEQSAMIRGRDGGYSGRAFDHSVWLYGDTVLSMENEEGSSWCNNTASWTQDFDASDNMSSTCHPLLGVTQYRIPLVLHPLQPHGQHHEPQPGMLPANPPAAARGGRDYALTPAAASR
jgi:hypothetical protein